VPGIRWRGGVWPRDAEVEFAELVHRESHGLVAAKIIEVDRAMVESFLGTLYEPDPGEVWSATAFRVVAFTDIQDSTLLTQQLGDTAAMRLLRDHDRIARERLVANRGQEVKHTGDGIMASFTSVSRGVDWACDVQRELDERNRTSDPSLRVRIGMSAGEPVADLHLDDRVRFTGYLEAHPQVLEPRE
jgi:class 3 adenylate cyclase